MKSWHNGNLINDNSPVLLSSDRALLGDGVFDTMLAEDRSLVYGKAHIDRLMRHAAILDITLPYTPEELLGAARQLLDINKTSHYQAVKTILTIGPGSRGLNLPAKQTSTCVISTFTADAPASLPGVSLAVARKTRRNEHSPLSRIKSLSYADNRIARQEVRLMNADEAILLNTQGNLACAASGNLFLKLGGRIYTPPLSDGVVDGIIRQRLLDSGVAEESSLSEGDLDICEGAWTTNSICGIRKVTSLDGRKISSPDLEISDQIAGSNI